MSSSSTSDVMRVSDEDRDRVAAMLRDAVGRGQLSVTEVDERLKAAYAAVTRRDLAAVIADLPQAVAPRPVPPPVLPTAAAAPARRVEWRSWLGGTLLLLGIWAMTSLIAGHALFFWPIFPIGFWALALVVGAKSHHHHSRHHHVAHRS